ncbi:hypothetical protein QIS99_18855 [Streptomyces sp. B-S-A8]|uniref:Uncharacterized protein n=1 Tax=Streptomyces solicavernae TaxID=3043614 RepID=A0ABT6RUX8_9ACTN|nr:hypothetical protein [Streptomyces sp. B-S-A8]MDI3388248.1 hypothetical protein [Streptomyces sp. B-S-A8]
MPEPPHVGKNAAEATAKLIPLQRRAEEEKAARKLAKAAKKSKANRRGKGKNSKREKAKK